MAYKFSDILLSLCLAATLASCDSVIYEDLPLCVATHDVRFVWDHNMDFSDRFAESVRSVTLYGFDRDTQVLRWIRTEKGEALAADRFAVDLEGVPAGEYSVVAWCGVENDSDDLPDSFTLSDMTVGSSTLYQLQCRMEREVREDGSHHSSSRLHDLFHGVTSMTVYGDDNPDKTGHHSYLLDLKKDTNRVHVELRSETGEALDPAAYTYTITEANGLLHHDNSLLDDEPITYHPFAVGETRATGVAADFDVCRLMADRHAALTVTDASGRKVVDNVSITSLALKVKDNYGHAMDDQEYLDRQDSHTFSFDVSSDGTWSGAVLYVNSWRVVLMSDVIFE